MDASDESDDYVVVPVASAEKDTKVITRKNVQELKEWLEPTDSDSPASEYRKHLHAHASGTGEWILETDQYRQWSESASVGNLWIRGIPGCGKSVVAANLISRLQQKDDGVVLFFFFREIIQANRLPRSLVQDFCHRLLDHSPMLSSDLFALKEAYPTVGAVPLDTLWKCLKSGLTSMQRKIYCVADALDEMERGNDRLLENLLDLGRQNPQRINIIVTSRQVPHLEQYMKGSYLVDLRLDRQNVDRDISIYLAQRLEACKLDLEEDAAESVKKAICDRGNGLFLYARLMFDQLLLCPDDILSKINDLPEGLGDMYTDILHEHVTRSGTSSSFQRLVLEWITHSARPMRLLELSVMIDSLPDRGGLNPESNTKSAIKTTCGPLLEVCEDGVIQIIHHSLTEFALNRNVSHIKTTKGQRGFEAMDSPTVHAGIAHICLNYFTGDPLKDWDTSQYSIGNLSLFTVEKQRRFLQFYFLQYALSEWSFHAARTSELDTELQNRIINFFETRRDAYNAWKMIGGPIEFKWFAGDLPPLLLVACLDLIPLAKHLLFGEADVNVVTSNHGPPLLYAVQYGNTRMVNLLLQHGARHDVGSPDSMLPVHYAAIFNRVECMKILIAHGADINRRGRLYRYGFETPETSLGIACKLGHQEIVLSLIEIMDQADLCNSLRIAAANGESEIVASLLQNEEVKLNINSRNSDDETALHVAARVRCPETVRVLLENGAAINARAPYRLEQRHLPGFRGPVMSSSYTPTLAWAAGAYFFPIKKLRQKDMYGALDVLLEAGGDINARDHFGRTPLFSWEQNAESEQDEELKLEFINSLLKRGADATILDHQGSSALHMSSGRMTQKILKTFIDAGLDVNSARSTDGKTPLMIGAHLNLIDPVEWHNLKADFNKQDWSGNTAFHYHVAGSKSPIPKWLDSWISCSNLHIQNHLGMTPLHAALYDDGGVSHPGFCSKASMAMLHSGSNFDIRDNAGRTPLHFALWHRYGDRIPLEFIEEILKRNVNTNARDIKGRSVLHYAFEYRSVPACFTQRRVQAINLIIRAGADINAVDYAGRSIFNDIIAAPGEWPNIEEVAAKIIELGGQVDVSDYQGRTALHFASAIDDSGYRTLNSRGDEDILTRLEYLLQPPFSFNMDARDHCGATPLHNASENSEFNVWVLIKAGALINAKDLRLRNPLHHASKCGQSNIVGLLTEAFRNRSMSTDEVDLDGRSALHHACQSGNPESVRLLIEAGADVTLQDERGRTPLHAAAELDGLSEKERLSHLESQLRSAKGKCYFRRVIQLLVAAGADPMTVDSQGHRPSDLAARSGCGTVLDELRHAAPSLHLESSSSLSEALMTMEDAELQFLVGKLKISNDDVSSFETIVATGNEHLVEKFAMEKNVKLFNDNGNSALHYVASHGLTSVMKCLLPMVEDIAIALPSILECATKRSLCNIEMVELLSKRVADVEEISSLTPSITALASGKHWWHPHALLILLNAGVPTEIKDQHRTPPLHAAVGSMHSNYSRDHTLEILLRFGADSNGVCSSAWDRDRDDRPLNYAIASYRDIDILQLLIDHGASICDGSKPPVYAAVHRNHIPALEMLLKAGADPNGTDDQCPLIKASETLRCGNSVPICSNDAVMGLLLRYGAEPLKPFEDSDGSSTVLHEICARNGNVHPIVAFGCDLNIRDANGRTPLMRACMYTEEDLDNIVVNSKAADLLAGGADPGLVDHDESTALHHAVLNYNLDAVRQVLAHSPLVSAVNAEGYTPLQCALKGYADYIGIMPSGYDYEDVLASIFYQIIHRLLDTGADPLDTLPDGRTALHCIAPRIMDYSNVDRKAQIEIDDGRDNFGEACDLYKLFLNAGCDREARDRNGETPIFHFVKGKKMWHGDLISDDPDPRVTAREDIEWLAKEHSIHSVNSQGDSLLHAITRRDSEDLNSGVMDGDDCRLIQIFIDLGLSPWQENRQGQTPLDIAASCQKRSILALFSRDD